MKKETVIKELKYHGEIYIHNSTDPRCKILTNLWAANGEWLDREVIDFKRMDGHKQAMIRYYLI